MKKTSKILYIGCIFFSLACAGISGFLAGTCLALEYPIYAFIFLALGFAHVMGASKALDQYRQL